MEYIYNYPNSNIVYFDTDESISAWADFFTENPDLTIDLTESDRAFEKLNNCTIVRSYSREPGYMQFLTDRDRLAFFLRYGAQ